MKTPKPFVTLVFTAFSLAWMGMAQAGPISVAPVSHDYGNVAVGATATQVFQVSESGVLTNTVTSVSLANNQDYTIIADNCSGTVVNGANACQITVQFNPTTTGPLTSQLRIQDFLHALVTSDLSGTGDPDPVAVVNPTSMDFGTIGVGNTSDPLTAVVTNTGSTDLTINGLGPNISGADAAQFVILNVANACAAGTVLSPGESCPIEVVHSPNDTTADSATLNIPTDDVNLAVSLSGNGLIGPGVSLNPSSLSFGSVGVGNSSDPQLVQVTNNGTTTLNITSVSLATGTDFEVIGNTCDGQALAVNASCVFQVIFRPTTDTPTPLTDSVDIVSDASSSPDSVAVDGTGIFGPAVALNPTSLSFGNVGVGNSSDPQLVQVTNNGTTTLNITSVSLGTGTDFEVIANTCDGQALDVGDDCVFQVVFRPTTDTPTPLTDSVDIVSDASTSPDSVAVDGTGVFGPALTLVPDPMTFPDPQVVGTTSEVRLVTIHSTGTTPAENLVIGALNSGTDFRILQDACSGLTLPVGSNCSVVVTFTPTTTGPLADFFLVTADNGVSEQADLNGTGIQSAISSSGSGAFGNVNVGSQGGPNAITITNTSTTASLNLGNLQQVGANPDQFAIANDNCSNASLAPSPGPGNTCTFQALFIPASGGARSDSVLVPNDSATPNFTVVLSGTGVVPGVALAQFSPTVLDYDLTLPDTGSASEAQTTTITNVGTSNLTITSLSLGGTDAGAFSQTNNCDGNTLAAGDSCTATVTFSTSAAGDFNATLLVASNSSGTPFLVLLGSARSDSTGGGGCSLNRAPHAPVSPLALAGIALALGLVWTGRRRLQ